MNKQSELVARLCAEYANDPEFQRGRELGVQYMALRKDPDEYSDYPEDVQKTADNPFNPEENLRMRRFNREKNRRILGFMTVLKPNAVVSPSTKLRYNWKDYEPEQHVLDLCDILHITAHGRYLPDDAWWEACS